MEKNSNQEIWISTARSTGDLAGVFEFDGDTGYFYLYNMSGERGQKVIAAIHILSGLPDFQEEDIEIRWSYDEKFAGLFIRSQLWAAFDSNTIVKHGGNYSRDARPAILPEILKAFAQNRLSGK